MKRGSARFPGAGMTSRSGQLLMAAAKEGADPGLRAQTVTILVGDADASDVREALAFAMANDENTNVRLKAMEGLQRYANDPMVQNALAHVLLNDPNTRDADAGDRRTGLGTKARNWTGRWWALCKS